MNEHRQHRFYRHQQQEEKNGGEEEDDDDSDDATAGVVSLFHGWKFRLHDSYTPP